MKIFIKGATGYIGAAVTEALVKAGHQVSGLARSEKSEAALKALGASIVKGDLTDPASFKEAASQADALVHIAFDYSNGVAQDKKTVEALLSAKKFLIYTSGVLVLGETGDQAADESHPVDNPAPVVAWRPAHEKMVLAAGGCVIRPGFVWGGKGGNFGQWFGQAEKSGAAMVVGEGKNRRAFVHKDDLAQLYRLILEKKASGVFHAVDGASPRVIEAARECSKLAGAKGEVKNISVEEATKQMGPFAPALTVDQVVAAKRPKELGWKLTHPAFPQNIPAAYKEFKN